MPKKSSTASAVLDKPRSKSIRVRAKILRNEGKYIGYYGVRRIREGQIFNIRSKEELGSWMELVDAQGRVIDEEGNVQEEALEDEVQTDNAPDGDEDVL